MSGNQALALANSAHGEQTGWRRNQDVIDALPYIDSLTPEEKHAVDALIEEEVILILQLQRWSLAGWPYHLAEAPLFNSKPPPLP
jgi:hypothetical protein